MPRSSLLAILFAGALIVSAAGPYDPAQLPVVRGTVAEYSLSPAGDVDGLILTDNTEIHLPPHLGTSLVEIVKPGDNVTVHGLRALAVPMVQALSITNDRTGAVVRDAAAGLPPAPDRAFQPMSATGRIRTLLHGPRGDLNGVLLEDGTIVRMPPPEAERLAEQLRPGASVSVQGDGLSGPLGRVIAARQIGVDGAPAVTIAPRPGGRP